jgi:hypothetical protein
MMNMNVVLANSAIKPLEIKGASGANFSWLFDYLRPSYKKI